MRPAEKLVFHADRTPFGDLDKDVVETLRQLDGARVKDEHNNVQFCGLLHGPDIGSHMFLPRTAIRAGNEDENLEIAKLTMQALARYGAETSKKKFEDLGEKSNAGALANIRRLTDDFRENGLFSERMRLQTRNSGKSDWMRTLKREFAVPNSKKQPVFANMRTSRQVRSNDALLTQIQAAILREILKQHGWWLRGGFSAKSQLVTCPDPPFSRSVWARKLDALLPTLYSSRSIRLVKYLQYYLNERNNSCEGTMVFGVWDFYKVWEVVLRETIVRSPNDERSDWNSLFPKPYYILKKGQEGLARSGMQTDIILQNDSSNFTIVDAKYYSATSAETAPGWPDIGKQMAYETALAETFTRDHGSKPKIRNVFAFPGNSDDGPLDRVEMHFTRGTSTRSTAFRTIDCVYISVKDALNFYARRTQGISIDR